VENTIDPSTGSLYEGPYHELLSHGKSFSGKDQNSPNKKLIDP
jgi:hypothetical protein